jgi:hypothetical protein
MPSLEHKIPPPVVGALVAGTMWWVSSLGALPTPALPSTYLASWPFEPLAQPSIHSSQSVPRLWSQVACREKTGSALDLALPAMKLGSDHESCIMETSRVDHVMHCSRTGLVNPLLFFSWRCSLGYSRALRQGLHYDLFTCSLVSGVIP